MNFQMKKPSVACDSEFVCIFFCREWRTEAARNPGTLVMLAWIECRLQSVDVDLSNPTNMDWFLLSKKLAQRAIRYRCVVAFGNHLRVEDEQTMHLISYNSGIASVFQQQSENGEESTVNYVGVLKDIFELDYGTLSTRIILLRYDWVKTQDTRGNPTYT